MFCRNFYMGTSKKGRLLNYFIAYLPSIMLEAAPQDAIINHITSCGAASPPHVSPMASVRCSRFSLRVRDHYWLPRTKAPTARNSPI